MRIFLMTLLAIFLTSPVLAEDALPEIPDPLQSMVDRGAQIRYLGKSNGMDGWITVFKGQEQYFYVLPNGAFLMGLLFDQKGAPITIQQVQALQKQGDDILGMMAESTLPEPPNEAQAIDKPFEVQSPAERMFFDVSNSNWVTIGSKDAPAVYAFIDPQCPHCHDFIQSVKKDYLDTGKLQVRLIPVGFREDTLAQAAFLLASPDAEARFYKHLEGDQSALPAKQDINNQGIQKNLALMQAWKFDVTPMLVYRGQDGAAKIVRGQPKDIPALVADIK